MDGMTECRACKGRHLFMCLRMGDPPPANQFLTREQLAEPEPTAPLNAYVCLDCALIQVPDNIPMDFFRNYVYVPSASPTLHRHFDAYAAKMTGEHLPFKDALIVDIGCNDGLFLSSCVSRGAKVLGIDPADNITARARAKGIPVVPEYFGLRTAKMVAATHPRPRIIVSNNTLNHVNDLRDFMAGIVELLDPNGIFVVEVPTALDLVQNNEFDTIYHEHTSEFSVKSFVDLYESVGMEVFDIEALPIHGGSMRVYAQKVGAGRAIGPMIQTCLARERDARLFSRDTYEAFSERVEHIRKDLMILLRELKSEGRRIAGAGAPAKGNTLLNYYGIGSDLLDYIADRSELKQGLYTPGMHILVVAPERILETQPDYLLVLAWNFAEEIMEQQEEYRRRGGQFIIPIPTPRVVQ